MHPSITATCGALSQSPCPECLHPTIRPFGKRSSRSGAAEGLLPAHGHGNRCSPTWGICRRGLSAHVSPEAGPDTSCERRRRHSSGKVSAPPSACVKHDAARRPEKAEASGHDLHHENACAVKRASHFRCRSSPLPSSGLVVRRKYPPLVRPSASLNTKSPRGNGGFFPEGRISSPTFPSHSGEVR